MNTVLISILVFILGLIFGALAIFGLNTLKLKRDAKINAYQPLFIDLDLPIIAKKKKISILSRNDQKTIMN